VYRHSTRTGRSVHNRTHFSCLTNGQRLILRSYFNNLCQMYG
jgi:hypothetical protein